MRNTSTSRVRPLWPVEVGVLALLLVAYDRVADLAHVRSAAAVRHAAGLLAAEQRLHLDPEHAVNGWLGPHRLLGQLASLYYDLGHASVTVAVLVSLYALAPPTYRHARRSLVALTLVALGMFFAFPVAPPRLVPGRGFVDVVARSGTWGSWEASSSLARHADQYASMPSLHVAWALWVLLAVRALTRRRTPRILAASHVAVTCAVVVATGNHYLADLAAGAAATALAWRLTAARMPAPAPGGVLVVSASMGAGHDGVAFELARRWRGQGTPVTVVDFVDVMPLGLGRAFRRGYGAQLKHAPGTYEWLYGAIERRPVLDRTAGVIAGFARRRLLRTIRRGQHTLAVATYPLAGRALGQLRRQGRLHVPTATFLTDVDVHATWLDSGTDLYLAVYDGSARTAARRTRRPAVATGPVLSPVHDRPVSSDERTAARSGLDLTAEDRVALLVTGSWGVGAVGSAVDALRRGGVVPVVLCGRNDALQSELAAEGVRAVGWTGDVRSLYAASDVVVHNAGGLSSLEAFGAGVPVIGHACLPGHGRRNAQAMADAGVAGLAADEDELVRLVQVLAQTPAGAAMAARAHALFKRDPVDVLTDVPMAAAPRPSHRPALRLAALASMMPVAVATTSFGVSEATTKGMAVARAPHRPAAAVYLAVQLDATELADPATAGALLRGSLSAVVPADVAAEAPTAVRQLSSDGVIVLAAFPRLPRRPGAARATCRHARDEVALASAGSVPSLVSLHGLGAWQLTSAYRAHLPVAVARAVTSPTDVSLHRGEQAVVAAPDATLRATLDAVLSAAAEAHLAVRPLGTLWAST
ncbi:MAG: phosphatase PAP2 family protein [Actinobacteria bacterium]|nr:phosphatase PAP2 family protein [Actinomycetota bacterium]